MKRVLIIGNAYDPKWTLRLVKQIKNNDPSIVFDAICSVNYKDGYDMNEVYEKIYWVEKTFPHYLYKLPRIRTWCANYDLRKTLFNSLSQLESEGIFYDVVNIHYLSDILLSFINCYRKIGKKIVLTPWGSDVLRASKEKLSTMAKFVNQYDIITDTDSDKFRKEIICKLGADEGKFLSIDFGSDLIDYIQQNRNISTEMAKKAFDLLGRYVITCGYNGADGQNHLSIINSLCSVKEKLPDNTTLLLPMGYGTRPKYLAQVEASLAQSGFKYLIVKDFLIGEKLLCLRKCTDVFIHAQRTDANSSSLAEYILCGTTILNGKWLSGSQRDNKTAPYYIFQDFTDLSQKLLQAISEGSKANTIWQKKMQKYGWSFRIGQWISLYKE